MEELIKRLRSTAGADRELDADIAVAIHGGDIEWRVANYTMQHYPARKYASANHVGGYGFDHVPRYTESIDAAVSLVPEGLTWQVTGRVKEDGDYFADVDIIHRCDTAPNPATALCIAALLARKDS